MNETLSANARVITDSENLRKESQFKMAVRRIRLQDAPYFPYKAHVNQLSLPLNLSM